MSGHSHFSTIKHKKSITDAKRGKVFSKISRLISIAVKEKGGNPATNPSLRMAIEEARSFNLPKENIERAIKKGSGELEADKLDPVLFEAFGPGGTAVIIEGITDNKNRTLGEIRIILNQNNGKLSGEGSVKWMFERKGVLIISAKEEDKEELELKIIEAGAEDIKQIEEGLEVYTKPEDLDKVRSALEAKEIKPSSASLDWVPKEEVSLGDKEKESCLKLFEALDDNDAVQDVYSNAKF